MRMMEHLLNAVREAAVFNPEVQMAPACILWPDRDRQWEAIIPLLQAELPELFILGAYATEKRPGPAETFSGTPVSGGDLVTDQRQGLDHSCLSQVGSGWAWVGCGPGQR